MIITMNKRFIVTIGREFGTGGRRIAKELADILDVKVYDRRLLKQLEERYNLTEDARYFDNPAEEISSQKLYNDEEFILRSLAEQESCIVLGRTGFHIFRDTPNAFKVFLIADRTFRRNNVARRLNVNEGSADALIDKVDEARENFTKTFSGKSRYDARNYDLVLNVSGLDPQNVARFIADCVKDKLND